VRLVTLPVRCHNSQEDAPDHEAADAEYPVAPIFRHVANMACSPCRQTMNRERVRYQTVAQQHSCHGGRLDLRLNVASNPFWNRGSGLWSGVFRPSHDVQLGFIADLIGRG
jgi:hypothetical protein